MITPPKVYIREVQGKGRGVFAQQPFTQDEIVEQAPVIPLPDPEWELLEKTTLRDYYFQWNENMSAILLGYGAIYNHSTSPNLKLIRKFEENVIQFVAIRNIQINEELTTHYDCPLWFEVV